MAAHRVYVELVKHVISLLLDPPLEEEWQFGPHSRMLFGDFFKKYWSVQLF